MIVWINGTHGVGKSTTSRLVQRLLPNAHILDAEKIGEVLMDIKPGLPRTDDFQHWEPWRPLVVETARRVLRYTGGILVMPMPILVESDWREIGDGLAEHGIPDFSYCSFLPAGPWRPVKCRNLGPLRKWTCGARFHRWLLRRRR